MTQLASHDPVEPAAPRPAGRYRAISLLAVSSLAIGVLSAATFLSWWLAFVPAAAIFLAWRALRQIERSAEEITGREIALAGIGLATLFGIGGFGWLWYAGSAEVPSGYQRVEYAELQPDLSKPDEWFDKIKGLNDKKIYIKGYMMPSRQQIRLRRFVLCPTNGDCKFCNPNPSRTEMILVTLAGDLTTDYTTRLLGIGGKFHLDEKSLTGMPYTMEVDYLY